jgi:hypothetical protein
MNFINSYTSTRKQNDKAVLELRFGTLTIFELYYDASAAHFRIMLLNFGLEIK